MQTWTGPYIILLARNIVPWYLCGTIVAPGLCHGGILVVPVSYQCGTCLVFLLLVYSCLVPVLYLCGTYWHLEGTCVVPMWYMFVTCPCRPEHVNKLLHVLGRSLYIARWQYYLLVPGWYHSGSCVVPGWYPCLFLFGASAASV